MTVAFFLNLNDVVLMDDKQLALNILVTLPDTASLHDIREELECLDSIKKGQQAAREGCTKTQDEVERQFASWNSR